MGLRASEDLYPNTASVPVKDDHCDVTENFSFYESIIRTNLPLPTVGDSELRHRGR